MPDASNSSIYFFYELPVNLRNRTELKSFIRRIFRKEGKPLFRLNFIFCDDKRILSINQQYLAHDTYTDIISFELSEKGLPVEGEIYISYDRVRENAKFHQQSITRELHRVIFHGVLHLCGYADKSDKDIKLMRSKEEHYLNAYL